MSQNQKDRPQVHACRHQQQTARGNDRIICTGRSVSQRVTFELLKFQENTTFEAWIPHSPKLVEPKLDTINLTLTFAASYTSWWCSSLPFPPPSAPAPRVSAAPVKLWFHNPTVGWGIVPAGLGAERAGGKGKVPNHSLSSSEMTHNRILRETLWNWLNLAERGFKTLQPFLLGNK